MTLIILKPFAITGSPSGVWDEALDGLGDAGGSVATAQVVSKAGVSQIKGQIWGQSGDTKDYYKIQWPGGVMRVDCLFYNIEGLPGGSGFMTLGISLRSSANKLLRFANDQLHFVLTGLDSSGKNYGSVTFTSAVLASGQYFIITDQSLAGKAKYTITITPALA